MKYEVLKQAKLIQWFLLGRRAGAQQLTGKEQEGNFWSDDNVLYLDKGLDYTGEYNYPHSVNMHLRFVQFIVHTFFKDPYAFYFIFIFIKFIGVALVIKITWDFLKL